MHPKVVKLQDLEGIGLHFTSLIAWTYHAPTTSIVLMHKYSAGILYVRNQSRHKKDQVNFLFYTCAPQTRMTRMLFNITWLAIILLLEPWIMSCSYACSWQVLYHSIIPFYSSPVDYPFHRSIPSGLDQSTESKHPKIIHTFPLLGKSQQLLHWSIATCMIILCTSQSSCMTDYRQLLAVCNRLPGT